MRARLRRMGGYQAHGPLRFSFSAVLRIFSGREFSSSLGVPMGTRVIRFSAAVVFALLAQWAIVLSQPRTITILHTNDLHASFMPHEAQWVLESPKPMVGGFARLWQVADSIKKAVPSFLMLDAGDVMTGNPITEIRYEGAYGGALFAMMNFIGYDAWCPGNHDFDVSQENLRRLISLAQFPAVSANLVNTKGEFPVGNRPYVILERGGMRIGIIGIISQELYGLVNQNNLVGIKVLSPSATVQEEVDELMPKTDLLIALTHEGVDDDSMLAAQVHGLNIIVGGHSHTRLKKPLSVNGVLIVQTGSNCENLGELTVTVENHKVIFSDGKLIPLWTGNQTERSAVSVLADSMQAEIDKEYDQVLATLRGDWKRKDGQSSIGTYIAEAQRVAAGAEVGFMNNQGIRRDVAAGPLTRKTLFEILPFQNILVTFQLSGAQLRSIMQYYVEKKAPIQIAGMAGKWKRGQDGSVEFTTIDVNGRPLEEDKMYVCAASDYFVGEAKHYLGLEIAQPIFLQQTVFAAVERVVRNERTITPRVQYTIERER